MNKDAALTVAPNDWDWTGFLQNGSDIGVSAWMEETELRDRSGDVAELRWLLRGIRDRLALYRDAFPDHRFERELEAAFARQAYGLEERAQGYEGRPETCDWDAYLTLKYEIRLLYKQLGAIVAGSDWQSPCKTWGGPDTDFAEEVGFVQEEQGTYERGYGSEAVKAYEEASLDAFYPMSGQTRERSVRFLTTSGMKALELALVAYKSTTREALPFYIQEGFYGEGIELTNTLLNDPLELDVAGLYAKVEANAPVGGLLVDPGVCWPVRPAVDLARLFEGLSRHRQEQPLYVIVDRTLTSVANPLFAKYADRLPSHVVLVSVESGIKHMQYGFDLANAGFLVATGRALEAAERREQWVTLLALLDAGADPVAVRQLPAPDLQRVIARLSRLNRNACWMDAFLGHAVREEKVSVYFRSVDPSPDYKLDGREWIGPLFYIQFPGYRSVAQYQSWIDSFVVSAPAEEHFVSGGSFGFDTFRMNVVSDADGTEAALRVSVGRDPFVRMLSKLRYMYGRM
ncbi:hypothetical protein ACFFNY_19880 [Paenibacillus hodogayensis]|uniref:Cystathionine beta-lyase n=1 Tax=Paenibacillus hodogayensis TaxID=279208 RepID=A0ABV5VZX9_9BACL